MRRLTWWLSALVALALCVGFLRAHLRRAEHELPQFAREPEPAFAALRVPLGNARLHGRVVDVDGAPVAGVALYLRSNDVPHWVTSAADGAFAFEELTEGALEVVALAWGHPPRAYEVATSSEACEIVLPPQIAAIPTLPALEYAPASGRVAHPFASPWFDPAGYEVVFVPRTPADEIGGPVERRVRTDERGFFAIDDLALGAYSLRVLPNWARGGTWPDLAARELADYDHTRASTGGEIVPLRLGALDVHVRDPRGDAIEGALALLSDADDPSRAWLPQVSDGFGRVRFLDLPPGTYALLVRAGEALPPEVLVDIEEGEVARPELPALIVRSRERD